MLSSTIGLGTLAYASWNAISALAKSSAAKAAWPCAYAPRARSVASGVGAAFGSSGWPLATGAAGVVGVAGPTCAVVVAAPATGAAGVVVAAGPATGAACGSCAGVVGAGVAAGLCPTGP